MPLLKATFSEFEAIGANSWFFHQKIKVQQKLPVFLQSLLWIKYLLSCLNGSISACFVYFRSFHIAIQFQLEKAWNSNPRLQDGRRKPIVFSCVKLHYDLP